MSPERHSDKTSSFHIRNDDRSMKSAYSGVNDASSFSKVLPISGTLNAI